ncbi:polysialyltransferase family glycosyltransferase [Parafilimonas sp.]|uniref:polysialyltransferase family glycosyltransferase n=1 Tax=Parafilimonas sp. TaxID=1969739 RepID=UPI0039E59EC1
MKHLFLVHSPITYLTAVSVINKLNLDKNNAVIIFFEFEKIASKDNTYEAVSINEFYPNHFFPKLYYYFRYFNIIGRIDRLIDTVTKKEKYTAYIPTVIWAGKALITNPKCVSFNFIEEGLAHYFIEETLKSLTQANSKDPWRSSILKNTKLIINQLYQILRGYNLRLQALPFSYSCYHGVNGVLCYGFSDNSFPMINKEKKIIVGFKKQSFPGVDQKLAFNLDNAVIWIGDGGVTQHGFNEKIYLLGIENGCIPFLQQQQYKKFFIKFHRDEKPGVREAVKNLFSKNDIQFQVIPDSVIMEVLLFKADNATLIGVNSSLLYYAAIMNHSAFSIYNFLKPEYSKVFSDRDFTFYWNKVRLIESDSKVLV